MFNIDIEKKAGDIDIFVIFSSLYSASPFPLCFHCLSGLYLLNFGDDSTKTCHSIIS